jgi:hypothetical protein
MSVTVYQSTRITSQQTVCWCVPVYCPLRCSQQLHSAHIRQQFCSRTAVATIGDVADFTDVRKWKWLFVNDSECKRPTDVATECFNPCHNVTDASLCLGMMF